MEGAQPHFSFPAAHGISEDPRFGPRSANLQVEAATVGVHAWFLESANSQGAKARKTSHYTPVATHV